MDPRAPADAYDGLGGVCYAGGMQRSLSLAAVCSLALIVGCSDEQTTPAGSNGADAGAETGNAGGEAGAPLGDATTAGEPDAAGGPAVSECFGRPLPERAVASLERPARPEGLEPYAPTSGWREATPEQAGMDAAAVDAALDFAVTDANTEALLIVRHGYVVGERYFGSFAASATHESFSMAKSVTSALVGIAIDEGLLTGTEARICDYYDAWSCDDAASRYGEITVDHALNIRTGLQWEEDWRGLGAPNDAFAPDILARALMRPVVDDPGTHLRYSTGDPALLTGVIQGATGRTVLEYANEKIFGPLGITGVTWASDSAGRTTAYAGLQLSARDFAKFGQLFLQEGAWDGEQVVPHAWVGHTTQPDDRCLEQYRYLWHINPPMRLGTADPECPEILGCEPLDFANLPGDAYFAEGAFGQAIYVVPSQDLLAVRLASDPLDSHLWDEVSRVFLGRVLDAVIE